MTDIFDIYLLETVLNGVLLGGVLALLALGLNLVFGVIDVVWICYAELIMLGMYGMYYLYVVNQLLATGGVLFLLQSAATVMFGIDFRNLGIRLPVLQVSEMFLSYARLLAFGAALLGMHARRIYVITSAIGGALAGLAACLLVLQYDVHPFIGLTFGPTTFMICVLGGLGNMIGGFAAA